MKNVLFATTALVAMTGSAMAASHGGMAPTISFSGEMTAGYNDVTEGGLFWDAELGIDASVDLGDSVTASLEWTILTMNETFAPVLNSDIPTLTITYTNGSMTTTLVAGDQDDNGASEMWYADRSEMNVDVLGYDDSAQDFTAIVEFGNFGVAATSCTGCSFASYGAKATFGSIELGLGYDSFAASNRLGVSADATFGAFEVGVSYASNSFTSTDSIGIEVGGTFGSIDVAAYYALNSDTAITDAYGVSADYSAGAFTLGAYFDSKDDGLVGPAASVTSYGVDLGYKVSDALTASAGVKDDGGFVYYAGIEYTVNDNISATVSYATANEISGPEFKDGISAFITASF